MCASPAAQPSDNDANGGDHVLSDLEQEFDDDEICAPLVSEKLATIFTKIKKSTIKKVENKDRKDANAEFQKTLEDIKRPENVEIDVPKVNPEIWDIMEHQTKSGDLRSQHHQQVLAKSLGILMQTAETCQKTDKDAKRETLQQTTKVVSLLCRMFHEISIERRYKIVSAPNVKGQLKKLVSKNMPVTKLLFGDELDKEYQAIIAATKMTMNMTQSSDRADYNHRGQSRSRLAKNGISGRGRGGTSRGHTPYQYYHNSRLWGRGRGRGRGQGSRATGIRPTNSTRTARTRRPTSPKLREPHLFDFRRGKCNRAK
jgi:hypothetical protein